MQYAVSSSSSYLSLSLLRFLLSRATKFNNAAGNDYASLALFLSRASSRNDCVFFPYIAGNQQKNRKDNERPRTKKQSAAAGA